MSVFKNDWYFYVILYKIRAAQGLSKILHRPCSYYFLSVYFVGLAISSDLHRQRDPLLLQIYADHLHFHDISDADHFKRMLYEFFIRHL